MAPKLPPHSAGIFISFYEWSNLFLKSYANSFFKKVIDIEYRYDTGYDMPLLYHFCGYPLVIYFTQKIKCYLLVEL